MLMKRDFYKRRSTALQFSAEMFNLSCQRQILPDKICCLNKIEEFLISTNVVQTQPEHLSFIPTFSLHVTFSLETVSHTVTSFRKNLYYRRIARNVRDSRPYTGSRDDLL